ncbi:hypothetical protein K1T71_014850 [Dendrolimus kikuchii]|nr:hypothetical protein K1T71_014850 [Dendrolimus kikuchii]
MCDPEKEHSVLANDPELSRVGVRVPPFYPNRPSLWFLQLESQFALANITTEATKFHYALAHLDPETAAIIEDVITAPGAADKYQKLKNELIKRVSVSREKKIHQLLTNEELGDRKPTQFLRHLKSLAGADVPEDFMRSIWTSRLPISTQTIIASQLKLPLDEIAELADRIHEVVPSRPQIAAASTETPSTSSAPHPLSHQVAVLSQQMQTMMLKMDKMSRQRGRSTTPQRYRRGRSSSARRSNSNYKRFPTCWYHHKFGDKATRCRQPCDFAGNARGNL